VSDISPPIRRRTGSANYCWNIWPIIQC